jgi:hypothetical protein
MPSLVRDDVLRFPWSEIVIGFEGAGGSIGVTTPTALGTHSMLPAWALSSGTTFTRCKTP